MRENFTRQLEPFVWMFVPFFFVLIGTEARLDVITDPGMPTLLVVAILAAIIAPVLMTPLARRCAEASR